MLREVLYWALWAAVAYVAWQALTVLLMAAWDKVFGRGSGQ